MQLKRVSISNHCGIRNAEHGFKQLIHTGHLRSDYQSIHDHEERQASGHLMEQVFLVTTKEIHHVQRARAERQANGLKITVIHVQRGARDMAILRHHLAS